MGEKRRTMFSDLMIAMFDSTLETRDQITDVLNKTLTYYNEVSSIKSKLTTFNGVYGNMSTESLQVKKSELIR